MAFTLPAVEVMAEYQGHMEVNGPPCFLFRHPERQLCRIVAGLVGIDRHIVAEGLRCGRRYLVRVSPGEKMVDHWNAELLSGSQTER